MADIITLDDAQLQELLQEHRQPDGQIEIPTDGWDDLTREQREGLAQRLLKAQEGIMAQHLVTPLDLDELDTRLAKVCGSGSVASRTPLCPSPFASSTSPSECHSGPFGSNAELRALIRDQARLREKTDEVIAYFRLVNDGGRPVYPLSLLDQVSSDPDNYCHELSPFLGYPGEDFTTWQVYRKQLTRWEYFRDWQNDNRGLEDDVDVFSACIERAKGDFMTRGNPDELAKILANPEHLRPYYDEFVVKSRKWRRRNQREPDCHGFPDYSEAVERRLARHGFTRSFQLHADPKQQDQLTTWIEYLCFECWCLDRHASDLEELQPDHDKRWQELLDLKYVMSHETPGSVRDFYWAIRIEKEGNEAVESRKAAEAESERVQKLTRGDPGIPEPERIQMLQAAAEELVTAQKREEAIVSRNNMIFSYCRATTAYYNSRTTKGYHATFVQWTCSKSPSSRLKPDPLQQGAPREDARMTRTLQEQKAEVASRRGWSRAL